MEFFIFSLFLCSRKSHKRCVVSIMLILLYISHCIPSWFVMTPTLSIKLYTRTYHLLICSSISFFVFPSHISFIPPPPFRDVDFSVKFCSHADNTTQTSACVVLAPQLPSTPQEILAMMEMYRLTPHPCPAPIHTPQFIFLLSHCIYSVLLLLLYQTTIVAVDQPPHPLFSFQSKVT